MRTKKNLPKVLGVGLLAFVYLSFSSKYFLPSFPSYFILGILATIGWLYFIYKSKEGSCQKNYLLWSVLFFFFWNILSLAWAEKIWSSAEGLRRSFVFTGLFLGLWTLFRTHREIHKQALHGVFLALLLVTPFYVKVLLFYNNPPPGFGYPFGNPNLAGSIFAFALCLIFPYFFSPKKTRKHLYFSLLSVLFLSCVFALARPKGAALATFLVLIGNLFLLFPRIRFFLGSFAFLGGGVILSFLPQLFFSSSATIEVRRLIWSGTMNLITASPFRSLFGWGTGGFFAHYPNYENPLFQTSRYCSEVIYFPHCFSLEIISELGIIGFFFALLIYFLATLRFLEFWKKEQGKEEGKEEGKEANLRYTALSAFAGLTVLLLHSQVSVAFSYPQVQCLAAIALAWLAVSPSAEILTCVKKGRGYLCFLAVVPFLFLFRYAFWDSLSFQKEYQEAFRFSLLNKEESLDKFLAISPPWIEDRYTLDWRNSLGEVLVNHYEKNPRLVEESLDPFWEIKEYLPRYKNFYLVGAVIYAKQKKFLEAESFFLRAAKKNPFSLDLWKWWAQICAYEKISPNKMYQTVKKYQKIYGRDGVLIMGEAFAKYCQGKREEAYKLQKEAHLWCEKRLSSGGDNRARVLLQTKIAGFR